MAKISRSAFVSMLGGAGMLLLAGCGSGTDKNSFYGGAYRSTYSIPELSETGAFHFTVNVKGKVEGSLVSSNGKTRAVSGELKNNGDFDGSTVDRASNINGSISGKMAAAAGTALTTAASVSGGNFTLSENGKSYSGNFTVGTTL